MFQALLRFYYHHRWAVVVAHVVIVTLLFVVYFNSRTMLELARFLSALPEDVQLRVYLFALILLTGTYATLLLDLSLRHKWEDSKGARVFAKLLGNWKGTHHTRDQEPRAVEVVASFEGNGVYARITTHVNDTATVERVEITDVLAGEVYSLQAVMASGEDHYSTNARRATSQLVFVMPKDLAPHLVERLGDAGQGGVVRDPMYILL
jgi:hypothetical protein